MISSCAKRVPGPRKAVRTARQGLTSLPKPKDLEEMMLLHAHGPADAGMHPRHRVVAQVVGPHVYVVKDGPYNATTAS